MTRRPLKFLALVALAACSAGDQTAPNRVAEPPSLAIEDGAHAAGNADFFFLPPMVWPTSSYSNWTHNGFNRMLSPTVDICRLVATTAAAVATPAGSQCRTTNPTPVTISGANVKKHFPPTADPSDVLTGLPGDWAHYHAKFPMPSNCNKTFFYRVRVSVGSVQLGFADVQCVTSIIELLKVDYKKFGGAFRGTQLQIPFRVERYALCDVPGVGPCGTASVVVTTPSTTPLEDPVTGALIGSVTIPAQTNATYTNGAPVTAPVVVNVEGCPDLRDRAVDPIDLPTFGPCLRITTDPEINLSNAATIFICTIAAASGGQNVGFSDPEQHDRVTLHRRDELPTPSVHALPHVFGCPVVTAAIDRSLKGLFGALVNGRLKDAGGRLLDILGPQPLYARRRLDVGGGGLSAEFSDFQLALPGSMTITGGDDQSGPPGSTLPIPAEVTVTDVGGAPVGGARVRFLASGDGEPSPEIVVPTPAGTGKASTSWQLSSSAGDNTLVARGFGLGGTDFSGPRENVDPFQPIQLPFDAVPPLPLPPAEPLQYGSVTFNANSADDPVPVPFGSAGYSYYIFSPLTAGPPTDWETVSFVPTGWASGGSPFGSGDQSGCGYNPVTNWGVNTNILLRKTFNLGVSHNVIIKVAIDNDVVQVFLNGNELSDGSFEHDGCAFPFDGSLAYYYGTAQAGSNLIAVQARDDGGSSYLDVQVELNDPCDDCTELRASTINTVGPRQPRSNQPAVRNPQAPTQKQMARKPIH